MSNVYNSRFDCESSIQMDTDVWNIEGKVLDATGMYFASDTLLNDIVYIDGSQLGIGPLRYKIISVSYAVGASLRCSVKWDLAGETPTEPITFTYGCIGRPDNNGVVPIPDAGQQMLDVAFTNSVRNMESILLSKKLNNISTPIGVMYQAQWDVDNDMKIDLDKLPTLDMGTFEIK
jgi:hypothetical protein